MPNGTRYAHSGHAYGHRYGRHGYGHGHDHCPERCPDCGPDAGAWAIGGAIVAVVVGLAAVLTWMVRHPASTIAIASVLVAVGLATGTQLTATGR